MRALNLSLDRHILQSGSAVERRLVLLAEKTGEIFVLVPGERNKRERISGHLTVQSVGGAKPFQFLKLWHEGSEELRAKKYDFITAQDTYFLGLLGHLLSRQFNIPLEVQVHGLEKFSGLRRRIAEFVFRRADRIRVVSERLKRQLTTNYQLPATKLYALPIYTQIDVLPRAQKRKTVPYPFTFLSVSRLVPVKNVGLQIRALAKVAQHISQVRLRIVGEGPEMSNLKLKVQNEKLEGKVIFEGEQKEVSRFYEEADAFVLTSDSEGWGLVVLEAAAHKLPIIMTDVGLAQEIITNERSGLIIPVGDEHELVLAMQELIDKPELRARLGEGAYRAFKALPTRETQIEKQVTEWSSLR